MSILKNLREKAGLSLRKAQDITDTSFSSIREFEKYKHGHATFISYVFALAKKLKLSDKEILKIFQEYSKAQKLGKS